MTLSQQCSLLSCECYDRAPFFMELNDDTTIVQSPVSLIVFRMIPLKITFRCLPKNDVTMKKKFPYFLKLWRSREREVRGVIRLFAKIVTLKFTRDYHAFVWSDFGRIYTLLFVYIVITMSNKSFPWLHVTFKITDLDLEMQIDLLSLTYYSHAE